MSTGRRRGPASRAGTSHDGSPGFWVIVRYAILFGVVLAFAALAFLALVTFGTKLWFTLPDDLGMVRRQPLVGG